MAKLIKKAAGTVAKTAKAGVCLTAYNVKTKEKGVEICDPIIEKNGNRYIAKGLSDGGDKLTAIISEAKAKEALTAGVAKKGKGW